MSGVETVENHTQRMLKMDERLEKMDIHELKEHFGKISPLGDQHKELTHGNFEPMSDMGTLERDIQLMGGAIVVENNLRKRLVDAGSKIEDLPEHALQYFVTLEIDRIYKLRLIHLRCELLNSPFEAYEFMYEQYQMMRTDFMGLIEYIMSFFIAPKNIEEIHECDSKHIMAEIETLHMALMKAVEKEAGDETA